MPRFLSIKEIETCCATVGTMKKTILIATVLTIGWVTPTLHAGDGSPAALYAAALARERGLRTPGEDPALDDYRAAIVAYDAIGRRFPESSYDDHALWQAAGLAIEAYDRYRQQQDLEDGLRLLRTLENRHPRSPFAIRVAERIDQLDTLTGLVWLSDIEWEARDEVVRVTVQVDREVRFHSEWLSNPPRLFFDFPNTEAGAPFRNATLTLDGETDTVRAIRLGRHPGHTTRLVIDTVAVETCNTFTLYDPFRIVVDCLRPHAVTAAVTPVLTAAAIPFPVGPASWSTPPSALQREVARLSAAMFAPEPTEGTASTRTDLLESKTNELLPIPLVAASADRGLRLPIWPESDEAVVPLPAADSRGEFSLARQLGLGVSRIVIDAGHGGHDPGARARGLHEADLVLDVAHRLEQRLTEQLGLEVVMTRRGDDYMPLEARTTLANRVQADLFLSIHANASQNTQARGVETYFLNFTTDPAAESVAARENADGSRTMNDLDGLLHTIATNSKLNESRSFAETVQGAMLGKLRSVDPEVPDLGVKQAPFIVLIGARMPSVLTEISFVTNRQDATLLSTDDYRNLIADALFEGILGYKRSLDAVSLLALQADQEGF